MLHKEAGVDFGPVRNFWEAEAVSHGVIVREAVVSASHDVQGGQVPGKIKLLFK